MSATKISRALILVGTLQGLALWWLWRAGNEHVWPATAPVWMTALQWAVLALPLTAYWSAGAGSRQRRVALLLAVALVFPLLGAYAGWLGQPLADKGNYTGLFARSGVFSQGLAGTVLCFMINPLVMGWDAAARRWDYHRLFELAWRNALLCVTVLVLTGFFWMVLLAGAMLMGSIGLGFIRDLIHQPAFVGPVTGMVVGAAFANGVARAEMLVNLRRYWLSINAWLLPLLLMFSLMWVLALPFTGLGPLLKTHAAAYILLWFCALSIKFVNCAWQDGDEEVIYPPWLRDGVRLAWLALLPLAGIAGWAVAVRVQQYGWTAERIWAAVIALHAAAYVLGYALSLLPRFRRQGWMATMGRTNVAVAVMLAASLLLLASPLADPRRLGVNDQLHRLHAGLVQPQDFDYMSLRFGSGQWGLRALQQLAADPRRADIALRARQALEQQTPYAAANHNVGLAPDDVRQRLPVLAGGALDDSLVDYLRGPDAAWQVQNCLNRRPQCRVWLHDFDGDGVDEALFIPDDAVPAYLLARQGQGWTVAANVEGSRTTHESLMAAIRASQIRQVPPVPPRWPDLMLGQTRLHLEPVSLPDPQ